jgi:hypothetical protein
LGRRFRLGNALAEALQREVFPHIARRPVVVLLE